MKIRGIFQIEAFNDVHTADDLTEAIKEGRPFFKYKKQNVITILGRKRVAELLGGTSTDFVTDIAIGDDGASTLDPSIPLVPTVNDTSLGHEVDRQSAGASIITSSQKVEFTAGFTTASLVPGDFLNPANIYINEAGLFTSDNVLFARRTFPSVAFAPVDRVGTLIRWVIEVL
jgi:hypothetical protein